ASEWLVCKNPKIVQAKDFSFSGLNLAGNTTNAVGSQVTPVFVAQLAGLNTLGISMARIDFAPGGSHPLPAKHWTHQCCCNSRPGQPKPGVITIANAVFGSNPKITSDLLAKAFQVNPYVINLIQSRF
ncbi:unnamed protein product, partial [Ilex paraguariensis]